MFSSISDHHQISPSLPNILLPPPRPQPNFDRKWKPHLETAPNCPRCASSNTKFCYYNNYSFSQPRYFCKSCRRYWTKGGSLRNVPVGGGCRKSRRPKSAKLVLHHQQTTTSSETDRPREFDESNETSDIDLAAVFARFLNTSNPDVPPESLDPIGNSEYLFDGISDIFDEKVEEMSVDELWQETEDMAFPSWNQELDCLGYNYNVNELKISESDQYCQVGDNWSSSFDAAAGFEVLSNSNP